MKIVDLKTAPGSKRRKKRLGRGPGSGHGKTSTFGHKGQKARAGRGKGPGFEGGQMPLQRRLPKRGFTNMPFKKEYAVVNLKDIDRLGLDMITPEILLERGVVKNIKHGLKVLGDGEITGKIVIKAHAFSKTAIEKIKSTGSVIEVLD